MKKVFPYNSKFVHVSCVNMLPEVYFDNKKENISNLSNLKNIKNRICKFCEIEYGYCIKCDFKDCE